MGSYDTLKKLVLENSVDNRWIKAREEWTVEPQIKEDKTLRTNCICGYPHLRYIYTIRNTQNGNVLTPIGDVCIKQFNNSDMEVEADAILRLYRLCQAVAEDEYIELDTTYFSRKFLAYLYEHNAFNPNQYNNWDGVNDYKFLLTMFNKRKALTNKQESKIKALIMNAIIPFASNLLN